MAELLQLPTPISEYLFVMYQNKYSSLLILSRLQSNYKQQVRCEMSNSKYNSMALSTLIPSPLQRGESQQPQSAREYRKHMVAILGFRKPRVSIIQYTMYQYIVCTTATRYVVGYKQNVFQMRKRVTIRYEIIVAGIFRDTVYRLDSKTLTSLQLLYI